MKALYLIMFFSVSFSMDNQLRININDIVENKYDDAGQLAKMAVCVNFNGLNEVISEKIELIVKKKIEQMQDSNDNIVVEYIDQLRTLRQLKESDQDMNNIRKYLIKNSHLYQYINQIIKESFEEVIDIKDKEIVHLEKMNKNKEIHKRIAIAVSVFSTLLTAFTGLLIHFVDN